jgi:hypothetical protein
MMPDGEVEDRVLGEREVVDAKEETMIMSELSVRSAALA